MICSILLNSVPSKRESAGDALLQALTVEEVRQREVFVRPYTTVFKGAQLQVNPLVHNGMLLLAPETDALHTPYMLGITASDADAQHHVAVAVWYNLNATALETIH